MTLARALQVAAGNSQETGDVAEAIDFDGTNDYLSRSSDLVGNTNSKTFTFSTFFYTAASGTRQRFLADGVGYVAIEYDGAKIDVVLYNTALSVVLDASTAANIPSFTWLHILISVNMDSTATRAIYINDQAASVTWTTYTTGQTIDWTHPVWRIGQSSALMRGRLSNLFLDYTYRDLTNVTNRRLFVTADLKPAAGQAALNPIMYLPMSDPTNPGLNQGTGGNFTLTGTVARSGRGPNQYNAPYSTFDGSADYLSRTAVPTGVVDGKEFTAAFVLNLNSTLEQTIFDIASASSARGRISVFDAGTSSFELYFTNSAGTVILSAMVSGTPVLNKNYSVVVSIDLSSTSRRHIYINGQAASVSWNNYTDANINFAPATTPRYRIGATGATTQFLNGRLGALWFNTSYIDLSQPANLAKFVTGTGIDAKPVDLGASGELPTGTSPLIYLPMYGNNAGKNYGTGGDFTVNSGPYTGARGPNEFFGNNADFDGTTGYLERTTGVGLSNGKTCSLSCFFSPDNSSAAIPILAIGASTRFRVERSSANTVQVLGYNAAGTLIFQARGGSSILSGSNVFLQMSFDLGDTGKRSMYINGSPASSLTWDTYTNDNIEFSAQRVRVGRDTNYMNGKIAELYFSTSYIDFSQEANRLKFRDAFGNPVNLTQQIEDAAIPNPAVYMRFPPTSFGTNSGTGGDFTVNGTITDGGQL
jgi:hypothetical protein